MWKIESIQAENLISFRSLFYEINQGVATLISGENLDGSNQRHNGSGKSALIEAISIALTGDYLRDVKTTEELINDASEDCYVAINLVNDYDGRYFHIERTLCRKESQVVRCSQRDADGEPINEDRTTQPSVNDYNKFILNEIGLTKEDIYNNYILCRNKYVSFLSAKDKDKKALINRFSNGVMVDESIEDLLSDMLDLSAVVNERHDEVVRCNARIDTINEQIANAEQNKQAAMLSRAEKIAGIEEQIAEKRGSVRELADLIKRSNERLDRIDQEVADELSAIEKKELSLQESYSAISKLLDANKLQNIDNITDQSESLHNELEERQSTLKQLKEGLVNAEESIVAQKETLEQLKEEHQKLVDQTAEANDLSKKQQEEYQQSILDIEKRIDECHAKIDECRNQLIEKSERAEEIKVRLHGAIQCPKCGHKFIVDSDKTVDELQFDMDVIEKDISQCRATMLDFIHSMNESEAKKGEIRTNQENIYKQMRQADQKVVSHEWTVRDAMSDVERSLSDIEKIKNEIERASSRIKTIDERLRGLRKNMFDSAFDVIDSAISRGESYVKKLQDDKKYAQECISQYEESIRQLKNSDLGVATETLQKQAMEYQIQLSQAEIQYNEVSSQYDTLKLQKEHFMAFKTYLANTKINAISQIINSFLEEIGSDIRVSIDGFRVLKSGKLSEKITINLLRDGVECGAFGKFSGGEKSRVELASILALQTLINMSCDDGKGLDFLALDEILEACDFEGISAACDTLNKLRKTSLVITQNPIEEGYPYQLVVTKENGISTI